MTKEELMKDGDFQFVCRSYGLDGTSFDLYGEVIAVNSPKEDIVALFNQNYQLFDVCQLNLSDKNHTREEVIEQQCRESLQKSSSTSYGVLPYPFQEFSLKEIMNLSRKIIIHELNHGLSFNVLFNQCIQGSKYGETYQEILLYITFLGNEIQHYFCQYYRAKLLGFDFPDVYSYIHGVVANIHLCIDDYCQKKNKRPHVHQVLAYLGQFHFHEFTDITIEGIISLLMKEKGFRVIPSSEDSVESTQVEDNDISTMISYLLGIEQQLSSEKMPSQIRKSLY